MDKLREKVSSRGTADCPFQRYRMRRCKADGSYCNIHWHPEAEILYMKQGSVEVRSGKNIFPLLPGQIAFIPPGQLHAIRSLARDSYYEAFVFSLELLSLPENHFFQRELIEPLRSGTLRCPNILAPTASVYPIVAAALDRICDTDKDDPVFKRTVFTSMIQLFAAMMDSLEPASSQMLQKSNQTLKACLQYMNVHFSQRITLQEIADQVHLHPNYLCAMFKDYTGHTVFQHLTNIRIEHAADLLRYQNISVADAADACGFESASFFAKKFKQIMGITPKEYRLRYK